MVRARRSRLVVGCGLLAGLIASSVGLTLAVVSYTNGRGDAADRLVAADVAAVASRSDVLAFSLLNIRPELRDEDPIHEIVEDIDDERELIQIALADVEADHAVEESIETTLQAVIKIVDSPEPETTPLVDLLALSDALLDDAGRLLASTSQFVDGDLITARAAIATHLSNSARALVGQPIDSAEFASSSESVVAATETLQTTFDVAVFDADVEFEWEGQLSASALDQLSEMLGSVDHASTVLIGASRTQPDIASVWLMAALAAIFALATIATGAVIWRHRNLLERNLRYQARHDGLTGLFNRSELKRAFVDTRDSSKTGVGVLYLDLDGFKEVNDTMGHHTGDALLREVARRLRTQLRSGDNALRLGGDEFVMFLANVAATQDVVEIGDRVIKALSKPMLIEEQVIAIGASVGAVFTTKSRPDAETLVRDADAALYVAKSQGRGRVVDASTLASAQTAASS